MENESIKKFIYWCKDNGLKPSHGASFVAFDKARGFELRYGGAK